MASSAPGNTCDIGTLKRWPSLIATGFGAVLSAAPLPGHAEVVLHNTGESRAGAGINVDVADGDISGSNLFHSFSVFNVLPGESVNFTGPDSINNVLSRVTGGTSEITGLRMSIIDGPLTSSIGSANFYFINPNGILIGNNAVIQVDGAFHASTADFVRLDEDNVFYADPSMGSSLSSAPPTAFGFLNANPAPIYAGSPPAGPPGPKTSPGQTISLVGGDIFIGETPSGNGQAVLWAQGGGQINLASVASTGEAVINGNSIDVNGFEQLGNIRITNGSIVDGRNIYIRAGQLVIDDAVILPGYVSIAGGPDAPPDGGVVDVEVSGDISISGTQTINIVNEFRPGIATYAGITNTPGGLVTTGGDVPDINVTADNIYITGKGGITSDRLGPGAAADVTVTATNTLEVRDGGVIALNNLHGGAGGQLTVSASHILLSGDGNPDFTGIQSQAFISPTYFPAGGPPSNLDPVLTNADGADIVINATGAGGLVVSNGASILGDSFSLGRSSDITINASDITLSRDGAATGSISTQSAIAGNSGNIDINVPEGTLSLRGGFEISATVGGTGDGGTIDITANTIDLAGANSGIFSVTVPPSDQALNDFAANLGGATWDDLVAFTGQTDFIAVLSVLDDGPGFIEFTDRTPGNGGQIKLTANQLKMSDDARIDSSTVWDGQGGLVEAHLGSLDMSSGAQIRSRSGGFVGGAGEPVVGSGNGGQINLIVAGTASISGQSALAQTGISTIALGEGNGGNISLEAGSVNLSDGGSITASSSGTGLAGNIAIDAGQQLNMTDSSISTQATVSDGGNIDIRAVNMIYLDQSEITTSVESGVGGGGNINIDPDFVILKSSSILANAYGGPGGNINIIAGNFIATPDSVVDASSALGIDGTVNISSPDEEVSEDLAVLPDNFLDVTSLISERCGTPSGGSSLVDAGPGGLTIDPDGYLPSYATATDLDYEEGKEGESNAVNGNQWWAPYSHQSSLQIAQLTCSR